MEKEPGHRVSLDLAENRHVATLRFTSESKMNVLSLGMIQDMAQRIRQVQEPPMPRVLVITGRADMFTGGLDLKALAGDDEAAFQLYVDTEYALFAAIERLPFVTIASIGGFCIGNGAELALACDFRIATESSRFSLAEARVGFDAPAHRLARYVGIGRAKEILFSGRDVQAREGEQLGLYTRVVPDNGLEKATEALVAEYAAMAPLALRLTKENVENAYGIDATCFDKERAAALEAFRSDDRREGVRALFERRPPRFKGH